MLLLKKEVWIKHLTKGVRTRMFEWLFFYLVLIPVPYFVVLFAVLFRLQLSMFRPNRSQVVRIELHCISVS